MWEILTAVVMDDVEPEEQELLIDGCFPNQDDDDDDECDAGDGACDGASVEGPVEPDVDNDGGIQRNRFQNTVGRTCSSHSLVQGIYRCL
jgi:hypothetical protein